MYGKNFKEGMIEVFFGVSQVFDVFVINDKCLICMIFFGNPGFVDVIV